MDARPVDALVDVAGRPRTRPAREVVLVSSGAIAAGLAPLGLPRRPRDLATQQAAASVGQGLLVHRYTAAFARHGIRVGQVLLTADDVVRRAPLPQRPAHAGPAAASSACCRSSTRTTPSPPTRSGSATTTGSPPWSPTWCAPTLLVLLSDVDGLYDGDPGHGGRQPDRARSAGRRTWTASASAAPARAGVGTGGMVTKVEAARIATGGRDPRRPDLGRARPRDALAGGPSAPTSTAPASAVRRPAAVARARLRPAGRASSSTRARSRGRRAPQRRCCRPGIAAVEGEFAAGDPVDLLRRDGPRGGPRAGQLRRRRAPRLLGRSTRDLARELGPRLRARGRPPRRHSNTRRNE